MSLKLLKSIRESKQRALTHICLELFRDMYLNLFRDIYLKLLSDMYHTHLP